jgi:putative inorganic carbon (hco3(-)) transporter
MTTLQRLASADNSTPLHPIFSRLTPLLWLLLAAALGVIVAVLPLSSVVIVVGLVVMVGAALITPIALLAALLVLAPLRTLMMTEAGNFGLPLDIGQWLLAALIGVWGLHRLATGGAGGMVRTQAWQRGTRHAVSVQKRAWMMAFVPLLVFIGAAAASVVDAFSVSAWLTELLKWVEILLTALLVVDLFRSGQRAMIALLLVTAGLANAVVGIYEYFGGSGALHLLIAGTDNFRAFGTFGQPNPLGAFMGITLPIALTSAAAAAIRLYHGWRGARRISVGNLAAFTYYGVAAAACGAALLMSYSRGAWLGFGVSGGVMLLAFPRKTWVSVALVGGAALLLALLAASGRLPASLTARLSSVTEDIFSVQDVRGVDIDPNNYAVIERLAHWQAAINMATDRPWLGVGIGNYEVAYPAYRLINWKFPLGHAHNYYLNVLAETGIIGLVAYTTLLLSILVFAWRARQHPDLTARLLAIGILGVWTYAIVHSLTDNLYVNNMFMHLGVTIGALALLTRDLPTRNQKRQISL